jgi:hypothetical protein
VAAACGSNLVPAKLELGGKGAAIVFSDTHVEQVAKVLSGAITLNGGQVCCTATRWIIHEDIYEFQSARPSMGLTSKLTQSDEGPQRRGTCFSRRRVMRIRMRPRIPLPGIDCVCRRDRGQSNLSRTVRCIFFTQQNVRDRHDTRYRPSVPVVPLLPRKRVQVGRILNPSRAAETDQARRTSMPFSLSIC